MGGILSFIVWLFTDPVQNRGRPQMFLPNTPTFTVRKRQSKYSDLKEKPLDAGGQRETELVSMRGFFSSRCPSFIKKYEPTWWLPKSVALRISSILHPL